MTTHRLVVVGIGGFGREVIDIIDALNHQDHAAIELVGTIDDSPSAANVAKVVARGVPYLGTLKEFLTQNPIETATINNAPSYVIAIADPQARHAIDAEMTAAGLIPGTLVHPSATIGAGTTIAPGVIICAGARLTCDISVEKHAHIHVNATIGHDAKLESFASVYPSGTVSGNCKLKEGSTVGANATVLQQLTVGGWSFIGAGAVVVRDVPVNELVKGVPAKAVTTFATETPRAR